MKKIIKEKINELKKFMNDEVICDEDLIIDECIIQIKTLLPAAETNDQLIKELVEALTKYIDGHDSNGDMILRIPMDNYKQLIERAREAMK